MSIIGKPKLSISPHPARCSNRRPAANKRAISPAGLVLSFAAMFAIAAFVWGTAILSDAPAGRGKVASGAAKDTSDSQQLHPPGNGALSTTSGLKHSDFLVGIYPPTANNGYLPADFWNTGARLGAKIRVVSFYQAWGPKSLTSFPDALVNDIWRHGAIPMISWGPWSSTFPQFKSDPELSHDRRVFHAILQGRLDRYIAAYARRLRDYHQPIFLRFAHEPENPGYPWSLSGGNTPDEYVAGWRYVVRLFRSEGAWNVIFVWNPWHPEQAWRYFPGAPWVDWFGLTLLNYGGAYRNGKWCSFDQLYRPFAHRFAKWGADKPTMLAEFGSTAYGGDRAEWLGQAMNSIAVHPEIQAVVFFHSGCDTNWPSLWRPPGNPRCIDWTFMRDSHAVETLRTIIARAPFSGAARRPVK